MRVHLNGRNNGKEGICVLFPTAAIHKSYGELEFGVYFLFWGVELEFSW